MKRLLSILAVAWLTLCGCSLPPPASTASDTARLDESGKAHQRAQASNIETIRAAIPPLVAPSAEQALARMELEEERHARESAAIIASVEKKAAALTEANEQLRSETMRYFRWMSTAGALLLAVGFGLFFHPFTRPFALSVIAVGASIAAAGIAMQTIYPWVSWAALAALAGSVVAVIVQMWRHGWKPFMQAVKVAEVAKQSLGETEREEIFTAKGSIANRTQSSVTKRLVTAAQKRIYARPLKGDK